MMAKVIPAAKTTHTEVIKTIRSSMCGAKLDACSGYNGNCDCTGLVRSLKLFMLRTNLAAPENPNPSHDRKNGEDAAKADDLENGSAIGGARGIVVVAEKQDVVDGRRDLPLGGVHQSQAHVAAGVFHAVEVARDAAIGGQDHHAAGMRKEIGFLIKVEAEIRGVRGGFNRPF